MIAPADINRLLAEVGGGNLVDGWAERNGLEEEVMAQLHEMADQALEMLMNHQMEQAVLAKLEEDEELAEEGHGMIIASGRDLMGPVAQTIAVCFFQIGWEAHKQYGSASQPSG